MKIYQIATLAVLALTLAAGSAMARPVVGFPPDAVPDHPRSAQSERHELRAREQGWLRIELAPGRGRSAPPPC